MAKKQKKSNQADPGDENVVKVKKKVSTKKLLEYNIEN